MASNSKEEGVLRRVFLGWVGTDEVSHGSCGQQVMARLWRRSMTRLPRAMTNCSRTGMPVANDKVCEQLIAMHASPLSLNSHA